MNARERASFKKKLLALQAELEKKQPSRIDPNRVVEATVGADEDEQPLNEMLQAIASGRNKNDAAVMGLIARALRKLDEEPDSYGECEDCGDDILAARLNAMPYARFCVDCQAKSDGPRQGPTRKKLTDYR